MSERFARLYGPSNVSTDPNSQTTMFTVPANKLYVIRDVTMVGSASVTGSDGGSATVHLTKDGQSLLSVGGASLTERFTGSVSVYGGETVQGYVVAGGGGGVTIETTPSEQDGSGPNELIGDFTGGLSNVPTNIYFFSANGRFSAGDGSIQSLTQSDITNGASIVSISETDHASIDAFTEVWGGDLAVSLDATDPWTLTYVNGPDYGWAQPMTIAGITLGAADAVVQTATASNIGDTATATVTITPVDSSNLQLVFVWAVTGSGTTDIVPNTSPTATIVDEIVVEGLNEQNVAVYAYLPGQTNPSFDVSSGPTTVAAWTIIAIEFDTPDLTALGVTVNGIVIE